MEKGDKSRKRDAIYKPIRDTTAATEPLKSIVSNGLWDILCWHFWGVISVSVSIVLIWFNLTEFALGATLGRNSDDTANILGILQALIQMHALSISASLFQIARQWIHGSLLTLDRGIPLGLLGAERQMGLPSFLISHGYLAAAKYSASLWCGSRTPEEIKRKWDVGMVTAFLFVSCVVSVLAGPASGSLMIPRVHWFFDSTHHSDFLQDGSNTYPYIMLPPQLGHGSHYFSPGNPWSVDPFTNTIDDRTSEYWHRISGLSQRFIPTDEVLTSHQVPTIASGTVYVNTTTTWGRSMDDEPATGSSYATVIITEDTGSSLYRDENSTETGALAGHREAMRRWSKRQYVKFNATAVVAQVNCQYRQKIPCPPTTDPVTSPWCLAGTARSLMLLSQSSRKRWRQPRSGRFLDISRVYITEGSRSETHSEFTDSLQVVLDSGYISELDRREFNNSASQLEALLPSTKVIVCSISTVITPAVMSSFTTHMDGRLLHCPFRDNNTLRYHENWLDHASTTETGITYTVTGNASFATRSMVKLVRNPALRLFGNTVNILGAGRSEPDPAWLELTIAGAFASIFAKLRRSSSQYGIDDTIQLPEGIIPEPRLHVPGNKGFTIQVYNQGYGFRLSTVGVFAVVLLVLHAAIVLVGSVWQLFWERSVITAWSTVPEYLALGLGSTLVARVLDNTCAGITAGESLRTIVKVGVTSPEHLEIQVGRTGLKPVLGRYDAKYGSRAERQHKRRS